MRVWDLSPGYLNRQSLLGEHRELHGIYSILVNRRTGYSRHPETLRWAGREAALVCRHAHLVAEMRLRGYTDRTPLAAAELEPAWPETFVTAPCDQITLLRTKYVGRDKGRIALPRDVQTLWAQHKYSVMARSPETYRAIGREVARTRRRVALAELFRDLVLILRHPPMPPRLANAVDHMWGYVRRHATKEDRVAAARGPRETFLRVQALALRTRQPYLLASTALSDLRVYLPRD